jgi:uncharacterized protein YjbJ (UPF0337 family)
MSVVKDSLFASPYKRSFGMIQGLDDNKEEKVMNGDRVEGAVRNTGGKVEEGLGRATGDAKSQLEGKMDQIAGTAQDLYGQAHETAGDAAAAVKRQAAGFEETLRDNIETRPYTAVAVALALGWFIGRLGRSY